MQIYTGIGSRDVPEHIGKLMFDIAVNLAKKGWELRSGGAAGSDSCFESGCLSESGLMTIYLPWEPFQAKRSDNKIYIVNRNIDTAYFAARFHPLLKDWSREKINKSWGEVGPGDPALIKLMARNVCQVLGPDPNNPILSKIIICYTKVDSKGVPQGGTSQALRIAENFRIPIYNLFLESNRTKLIKDYHV